MQESTPNRSAKPTFPEDYLKEREEGFIKEFKEFVYERSLGGADFLKALDDAMYYMAEHGIKRSQTPLCEDGVYSYEVLYMLREIVTKYTVEGVPLFAGSR